MIVPFPPGGVADIVGRPLASQMEKALKQPVVVVNRTGAGGAVGMAAAAKAAPDGYTILMALSSISIFPVSDRINGKAPVVRDEGLRADRADHRRPDGAGGVGRQPVEDAEGVRRRRPRPIRARSTTRPRACTARCTWRWRSSPTPPASSCSTCPTGRRAGADRAARRPGARARLGPGARGRADQGRQDARARELEHRAPAADARGADLQGARLRRRVLHLVGRVRARRDPDAGARPAARRGARGGDQRRSSRARWRRCRRR